MFPTLSDLINYLFGIYIPLPIQTFGFVMALSFVAAYYTTASELKRKEQLGLIKAFTQKITRYKKLSFTDYAVQMTLGGIIGYKVVYMLLNYDDLVVSPQSLILSTDGSFLGLVVGAAWAYYQNYKEDQLSAKHQETVSEVTVHRHELMWNVVFIAAVAGILGAKVFHNLENMDEFLRDPIGSLLSFSGLTFYGGLIVATIAVLYYTGKHKIPALHMMDAAAPALILAYGVGRIGCQMSGDGDWGIVNNQPLPDFLSFLPQWMWGFTYPHNVINEGVPIPGCDGIHCFALPEPVFPTPFYESVMAIGLFFFLWSIRKRISTPGMMFSIYLIVNGIERFFIEKIRVNSTYNLFGHHITQAEIISSCLFIIGAIGTILLYTKGKKESREHV